MEEQVVGSGRPGLPAIAQPVISIQISPALFVGQERSGSTWPSTSRHIYLKVVIVLIIVVVWLDPNS
jgi:hypothetical protein